MVEYLNDENDKDFTKIFNKAIKKYEFEDLRSVDAEKCILLYKEGQSYVGFLEGFIDSSKVTNARIGRIIALYVVPSYRNEGKAYTMISEFESWIKDKDCKEIIVGMDIKNRKSQDFFQKVSFQNIGTCLVMKKSINSNL